MVRVEKTDSGLCVTFDFDWTLVEILNSIPGSKFERKNKQWLLPTKSFYTLEDKLLKMGYYPQVIDNTTKIINKPYSFKTKPFPHQLDGFEFGKNNFKWVLGDDPGLGKTFQSLNIAKYKKDNYSYRHCLIVVCLKDLKDNWENEVKKHTDEESCIIGKGINGRYPNAKGKLVKSETKDKLEHLKQVPKEYFWILNVHSLRDKEIQKLVKNYVNSGIISMVIIDEIHRVKKKTSQQGEGLLKLENAKGIICVTGTPLETSPMDGYIPLRLTGMVKQTWTAFQDRYCVRGKDLPFDHPLRNKISPHQIMGFRNMKEYRGLFKPILLRRAKEDVFNLPEKIIGEEYLELGTKQRSIYNQVKDHIAKNIDKIILSDNPLADYTRLRQVTAHPLLITSKVTESVKFDNLMTKLEELNEKIIVFSTFETIITMLYKEFKQFNPAMVTGKVKSDDRIKQIQKFQEDDNCKVILGTYPALGVGWNLTAAGRVEHFDNPWAAAVKNQATDRAHRIGTTGVINVNTLLCKNTIDEKIKLLVEKKSAMSDYLIDGKIVGNRKEFLNWLLD